MIDADGYRPNVGIILANDAGKLLWARRVSRTGWQFPQGGIRPEETPEQALYRELAEEIGLGPDQVELLGATRGWLRYRLPRRYIRHHSRPLCIGQKQRWFVLRLLAGEEAVQLDTTDRPEFDHWIWVDYWRPVEEVIFFKREVYARALEELAPLLFPEGGVPAHPGPRPRGGRRRPRHLRGR